MVTVTDSIKILDITRNIYLVVHVTDLLVHTTPSLLERGAREAHTQLHSVLLSVAREEVTVGVDGN